MTEHVTPVGNVPTDDAGMLDIDMATRAPLRIVHTSDTHLEHDSLLMDSNGLRESLPHGDVLVHSGDFNRYKMNLCVRSAHYEDLLYKVDSFFASCQHNLKVFVAGNHESVLDGVSLQEIQQHLPNCVYLCNSSTQYEGLNIYGSPHTANRFLTIATGFSEPRKKLKRRWNQIPDNTDVLITHMPPHGILDLGSDILPNRSPALFRLKTAIFPPSTCKTCGFVHCGRHHWGCVGLRDTVLNRVKPKLHLFGHVHECYGTLQRDNTVFSNGAFLFKRKYNVFDYYMEDNDVL